MLPVSPLHLRPTAGRGRRAYSGRYRPAGATRRV